MAPSSRQLRVLTLRWPTCLLLIALLAGVCPNSLVADQVNLSGIAFEVDELQEVDDENLKLTIRGETMVLSRAEIGNFLIERFFTDPELSAEFDLTDLERFVRHSLKDGRLSWAELGSLELMRRSKGAEMRVRETLTQLLEYPGGIDVLKSVLMSEEVRTHSGVYARSVLCSLILGIGLRDPGWTRANTVVYMYRFRDDIKLHAEQELMRLIRERKFDQAGAVVELASELFGAGDPVYRKLHVVNKRAEDVMRVSESGSLGRLYELLDEARVDSQLIGLIGPLIYGELHKSAQRASQDQRHQTVLRILSHVDMKSRTPLTHELIGVALANLDPSQRGVLLEDRVRSMLRVVAANDPSVRQTYIRLLSQSLRDAIKGRSDEQVPTLLQGIQQLRPDPNAANDRLRVALALIYLNRGDRGRATRQINNIQTGIPLDSRVRLLSSGYYFSLPVFFIVLGVPFLLFALLRYRAWRLGVREIQELDYLALEPGEEITEGFRRNRLSDRIRPGMYEYHRLLHRLGLQAGADIRSIKGAYRNAVKSVHPDTQGETPGEASDKFIELNRIYERILELRRELGLPNVD